MNVKLDAGKVILTGASGTDQLTHIERVIFSDDALAFDADGVAGKAYRIYQAAFNRKPDAAGYGFWLSVMDGGASIDQAAGSFVASKEFRDLYGANPSNTELLTKLYFNVLHREGDKAGFAWWLDVLDRKLATPAQVLALLSESPENVEAPGPAAEAPRAEIFIRAIRVVVQHYQAAAAGSISLTCRPLQKNIIVS